MSVWAFAPACCVVTLHNTAQRDGRAPIASNLKCWFREVERKRYYFRTIVYRVVACESGHDSSIMCWGNLFGHSSLMTPADVKFQSAVVYFGFALTL